MTPTGASACCVKGSTWFTALGHCPGKSPETCSVDTLLRLQMEFRDVYFLFIDELSLLGTGDLSDIDKKLRMVVLSDARKLMLLAGYNTILSGDGYQLFPVMKQSLLARSIAENTPNATFTQ